MGAEYVSVVIFTLGLALRDVSVFYATSSVGLLTLLDVDICIGIDIAEILMHRARIIVYFHNNWIVLECPIFVKVSTNCNRLRGATELNATLPDTQSSGSASLFRSTHRTKYVMETTPMMPK